MTKWTVNLSGCVEARNADEAKKKFFGLYAELETGVDIQEKLNEGEHFDFSVGFSGYGD